MILYATKFYSYIFELHTGDILVTILFLFYLGECGIFYIYQVCPGYLGIGKYPSRMLFVNR